MPRGIFLLVHDEIKGPEIVCSYYKIPITLSQDFISKLYMSHAGFESSSSLEMRFSQYRIISCFTGHIARKKQKEGVIGLILEEDENVDNLELFLQRNLNYGLVNQNDQTMKAIFTTKLMNYMKLNQLFERVAIEGIPELFIINGDREYKSCLLRIGEKKITKIEMAHLYHKIIDANPIPQFRHFELELEREDNVFLVVKVDKPNENLNKIISIMKPYLEHFFEYSLEILALFLLVSVVGIIPLNPKYSKKYSDESISLSEILKNSNNYGNEFNDLIPMLLNEEIYLSPLLDKKFQ